MAGSLRGNEGSDSAEFVGESRQRKLRGERKCRSSKTVEGTSSKSRSNGASTTASGLRSFSFSPCSSNLRWCFLNIMAMSHLFLSSPRPSMALRLHSTQFTLFYSKNNKDCTFKGANEAKVSKRSFLCRAIHMESEHSGKPKRLSFDNLLRKTKVVWNNSPQPVTEFPWNRAFVVSCQGTSIV